MMRNRASEKSAVKNTHRNRATNREIYSEVVNIYSYIILMKNRRSTKREPRHARSKKLRYFSVLMSLFSDGSGSRFATPLKNSIVSVQLKIALDL